MEEAASIAGARIAAEDHRPESAFRGMETAFARAAHNAGGCREMVIDPAGVRIRIRCPEEKLLARIGATLEHLETASGVAVDFTICCWDAKTNGGEPALPGPRMLAQADYGCLTRLTNHRFRTFYAAWAGIFCCVDLDANTAYCRYEDGANLMMYEVSGPLRGVFAAILNRREMHLVHASAIGTPRGTLLFAGPPGSGKSTLAIQCLQAGLFYQSDDLCILTAEKEPRSLSLYNIAKLREDALPRFVPLHPLLAHFQEEEEKKSYFYVHRHFPAQVLREAPVLALVLPTITGEPVSRLERASPMDAVRGVVTWSVKEIPRSDTLGERIMLQAVSRLPAWRLHLGRDDESTLAIIRSLLDDR